MRRRLLPLWLLWVLAGAGCTTIELPDTIEPVRNEPPQQVETVMVFYERASDWEFSGRVGEVIEPWVFGGATVSSVGRHLVVSFRVPTLDHLKVIEQAILSDPALGRSAFAVNSRHFQLRLSPIDLAIEGRLTSTLKGRITQGARLFLDLGEGQREFPVAADGSFSVDFVPSDEQIYVYGQTLLGGLSSCIRLDIYTGTIETIDEETYRLAITRHRGEE